MANPMGEDSWLAYVEEERRHASDLDGRVKVVELFKKAIVSEPGSLSIWLAYCDYFWSLFTDCQSNEAGWSEEEQMLGRELFSFDSALSLWSEGYEAIKYRLNDSHRFWNRWISIEQEQLARTRTPVGVKRISHLFRDRLQVPHATWDDTSQMFSSFLSTYNNGAYETEFKEVTANAQDAKRAYDDRERFELKLSAAARSGNVEEEKTIMRDYLDWSMTQTRIEKNQKRPGLAAVLCDSLYSRALTSILAFDDDVWLDYVVFLSTLQDQALASQTQYATPNALNVLQRAVNHCPWSGMLWSRYILSAEEAGWSFADVESIKHAATNTKVLDKNGMTSVLEMYAAWCGYLKRNAMRPNAPEDAVDVADVGLTAALEDVDLWGRRLYKDAYQGDPNYRLERILIQYLTEKKGEVDEARAHWNRMAQEPLLKNSYDFWLNYYLWEMVIFASHSRQRSPTPATPANGVKPERVPTMATNILLRALEQRQLDWPERVMEVCGQHCNDYEKPETLRFALDTIHRTRQGVAKRRQREQTEAAAAYAAQMPAQEQESTANGDSPTQGSPTNSKRKRGETPEEANHPATKRPKSNEASGNDSAANEQAVKRDRENTTVMVTNLPADVTQGGLRKYFREYGQILNVTLKQEEDGQSTSALIEFETPEEMRSALLRDNKYFGQAQISVKPGTGLTIYVTNFPPTADDQYIRQLYKDSGEIFSIRWPSLKYNTHRRFCYISFRDQGSAAKATNLDGMLLEGKYRLLSKYSDPGRKKKREGPVAEGRELHITNVDSKVTEEDLAEILGKYGKVERVRILRKLNGQSVGTAFAVFESKEETEKALELDKTKLKGSVLEVEISKSTNYKPMTSNTGASASPAPSGDNDVAMADEGTSTTADRGPSKREIQDRTMAILNIPDTVNDARVRSIAEQQGNVIKLVLRPDHGGAIVEYADAATVGRAMLALDNHEVAPGQKLRTGTVGDLFKEKRGKKADDVKPAGNSRSSSFMPPPQAVRRPFGGGGGRGGPKRGLGFAPTKKTDGHDEHKSLVNGTAPPAKPKSNAEFRDMFLKK